MKEGWEEQGEGVEISRGEMNKEEKRERKNRGGEERDRMNIHKISRAATLSKTSFTYLFCPQKQV